MPLSIQKKAYLLRKWHAMIINTLLLILYLLSEILPTTALAGDEKYIPDDK
jgi:hypothetical protein